MTLNEYETLTGITVPANRVDVVTAQITRTQRILETMLGFTLTEADANDNEYTEIGKTALECPCPNIDVDDLEDPDAVVYAYRMYRYNLKDHFLVIDPCTDVHAVKLVKDGVTFRTLDPDEYRLQERQGFIKYIEDCEDWCFCATASCFCVQMAVDADWLWDGSPAIPDDLNQVWAEMTTWYSDPNNNVRSQTLGTHNYSKWDDTRPEMEAHNKSVIKKYAGPNGSEFKTLTI